MIPEWLQASILTGVTTGLIAYGGIAVHIKWLHSRLNEVVKDVNELRKHIFDLR